MKADMHLQLSRMMTTSMLVCRCSIHVRAERDTRYKLLQSVTKIGGRLLSTSPRSRRFKVTIQDLCQHERQPFYGSWSRAKGLRLCSQRTTNSSTEFITAPCSGYPFGFSPILQRFLGEGDDVPAWVCSPTLAKAVSEWQAIVSLSGSIGSKRMHRSLSNVALRTAWLASPGQPSSKQEMIAGPD